MTCVVSRLAWGAASLLLCCSCSVVSGLYGPATRFEIELVPHPNMNGAENYQVIVDLNWDTTDPAIPEGEESTPEVVDWFKTLRSENPHLVRSAYVPVPSKAEGALPPKSVFFTHGDPPTKVVVVPEEIAETSRGFILFANYKSGTNRGLRIRRRNLAFSAIRPQRVKVRLGVEKLMIIEDSEQ